MVLSYVGSENDDAELCTVMEFCGCGDLSQKIERYKKRRQYIDERVIWVYLIQMLEGLKALHEKNIMHRGTQHDSIRIRSVIIVQIMGIGISSCSSFTAICGRPEGC